MSLQIRLAIPEDAPAVAVIHVRCWQFAYRGIVPDAILDILSIPAHEQLWGYALGNPTSDRRLWVADDNRAVVGFCETGPSSDDDATPDTAEVGAIYLEPERIGTGVGRPLFQHAVDDLCERGFRCATLWVFRDNPRARQFYEAAGWHPEAERTRTRGDALVVEIRYRTQLST